VAPANELIRFVLCEDGHLTVGRSLPGRGAWLCAGSRRCLELAQRRQSFSRALRTAVSPAALVALRGELAGEELSPHILGVCEDKGWGTSKVDGGPEQRDDGAGPHGED